MPKRYYEPQAIGTSAQYLAVVVVVVVGALVGYLRAQFSHCPTQTGANKTHMRLTPWPSAYDIWQLRLERQNA